MTTCLHGYMQTNPRISANLLVMLVRILVNLPVELTKLELGGATGLWVRGIHSGEAMCRSMGLWVRGIHRHEAMMRLMSTRLMRLARNIARIARNC